MIAFNLPICQQPTKPSHSPALLTGLGVVKTPLQKILLGRMLLLKGRFTKRHGLQPFESPSLADAWRQVLKDAGKPSLKGVNQMSKVCTPMRQVLKSSLDARRSKMLKAKCSARGPREHNMANLGSIR